MINNNNNKTEKARQAMACVANPPFYFLADEEDFLNYLSGCHVQQSEIIDLLDISKATFKRWLMNDSVPAYAWLVAYVAGGCILDKAFKGHRIKDGTYYPNIKRTELKPAQFETWQWGHALQQNRIDVLTHEKNALQLEINHLKDDKQKEEEKTLYKNIIQFKEFTK